MKEMDALIAKKGLAARDELRELFLGVDIDKIPRARARGAARGAIHPVQEMVREVYDEVMGMAKAEQLRRAQKEKDAADLRVAHHRRCEEAKAKRKPVVLGASTGIVVVHKPAGFEEKVEKEKKEAEAKRKRDEQAEEEKQKKNKKQQQQCKTAPPNVDAVFAWPQHQHRPAAVAPRPIKTNWPKLPRYVHRKPSSPPSATTATTAPSPSDAAATAARVAAASAMAAAVFTPLPPPTTFSPSPPPPPLPPAAAVPSSVVDTKTAPEAPPSATSSPPPPPPPTSHTRTPSPVPSEVQVEGRSDDDEPGFEAAREAAAAVLSPSSSSSPPSQPMPLPPRSAIAVPFNGFMVAELEHLRINAAGLEARNQQLHADLQAVVTKLTGEIAQLKEQLKSAQQEAIDHCICSFASVSSSPELCRAFLRAVRSQQPVVASTSI
jgi:hypothetical protein